MNPKSSDVDRRALALLERLTDRPSDPAYRAHSSLFTKRTSSGNLYLWIPHAKPSDRVAFDLRPGCFGDSFGDQVLQELNSQPRNNLIQSP